MDDFGCVVTHMDNNVFHVNTVRPHSLRFFAVGRGVY